MKALIVSYLPRGERSKTKMLVDALVSAAEHKGMEVEQLELLKDAPDFLDEDKIQAYVMRNYMDQVLPPEQASILSKMDRMTDQFKNADAVIVAFPMYNFSMPALMKAYFDSIMLKGETWDADDNGYVGLMKGKKALILLTSGGDYTHPKMQSWEHAVSLARTCFQFMGFSKIDDITVGGVNADPDKAIDKIERAALKVNDIVNSW